MQVNDTCRSVGSSPLDEIRQPGEISEGFGVGFGGGVFRKEAMFGEQDEEG